MTFSTLSLCVLLTAQVADGPIAGGTEPAPPRPIFDPNVQPAAPTAANAVRAADGRELKSVLRTGATMEEPGRLATGDDQLPPVQSSAQRGSTTEVLKQALTAPQDGAITGRPYSLFEVISRTGDRNQQIWTTKAYWKLSVAVADYNFASEEQQRLEVLSAAGGPADAGLLQSAKSAASARVREAEIAAIAAQYELADLLFLPPGEPLPVPSDSPHAGQYRTHFETLFAARIPPTRARLIDRTLPIRRELIDQRASAVQAAASAASAAEEAYARGAGDLRSLLEAHHALWQQRRGFLTAVRDYNHDIAEFALTVAQIGTSEAVLVSMLIKTPNMPVTGWPRNEPTPAIVTNDSQQLGQADQPNQWTPARQEEVPQTDTQASPISPFPRTEASPSVMKQEPPRFTPSGAVPATASP